MKPAWRRLGICFTVALAVQLFSGAEQAAAQIWPTRFEPEAEVVAADPGGSQILGVHIQSRTASTATTAKQLLSQSDLLPYCADGDGCRITLLMFRGSGELPVYRGERDLFVTSAGDLWKLFQGSAFEEVGDLTDGSLETVFFLGGLDRCELAEDLTPIGSIERFFLVSVADASVMPPASVECRLRMED